MKPLATLAAIAFLFLLAGGMWLLTRLAAGRAFACGDFSGAREILRREL
jgi:hypothetical protein